VISPKTASVHVSNLRNKTGSESRIELALEGRRLLGVTD
jgi:DNA-binding CsgD family transcriptional regulator